MHVGLPGAPGKTGGFIGRSHDQLPFVLLPVTGERGPTRRLLRRREDRLLGRVHRPPAAGPAVTMTAGGGGRAAGSTPVHAAGGWRPRACGRAPRGGGA